MGEIFYLSDLSSYSSQMSEISYLYDSVMVVVVGVLSVVVYVFFNLLNKKSIIRKIKSSEVLEIFWTILPTSILGGLAVPSLLVLYLSEEVEHPYMTVKVTGHQWYWSYEFSDLGESEFNSYMVPTNELWEGGFRLLEVDRRIAFPLLSEVRVLVTSSDVIHSWALPPMGVKLDAIPGRLNQLIVLPTRVGVVYGQCSEICGVNHSFMPICLEVLTKDLFLSYLLSL